jgi:hypothetical protein
MAYDMHLVRTKDWTEAAGAPISKDDVDSLLKSDPELTWSTTDYMDMKDDSGTVTRYYAILWNGDPCFIWCKDQIICAGPSDAQQIKLVRIAQALGVYAVGDDGERYELRKTFFGKPRLVVVQADAYPLGRVDGRSLGLTSTVGFES